MYPYANKKKNINVFIFQHLCKNQTALFPWKGKIPYSCYRCLFFFYLSIYLSIVLCISIFFQTCVCINLHFSFYNFWRLVGFPSFFPFLLKPCFLPTVINRAFNQSNIFKNISNYNVAKSNIYVGYLGLLFGQWPWSLLLPQFSFVVVCAPFCCEEQTRKIRVFLSYTNNTNTNKHRWNPNKYNHSGLESTEK